MANQNGFPGALPAIVSGLEGSRIDLVPGEGFWARIEQIAVKGEVTRGLDTVMHGRPSPRLWLFLHEPGRGELSAVVAMSFARELAFRDQAAMVLDCDDQDQALTRWTGRLEAEGWIDLARYGTSVLTSGMPMPFVGRRGYVLGVGSFAPTDVTGKEVDTLLTRLRRQADDLLLVAPANSAGLLWAPAASIRVLCWDKEAQSADAAGEQARKFEEAGCPLTAVVTFQPGGAAAEKLVDDVLAEVGTPPKEDVPVPPAPAAPESEEVPEAPVAETQKTEPREDAEPPEETVRKGEPEVGGDIAAEQEGGWKDLPLEQEFAPDEAGIRGPEAGEDRPDSADRGFELPLPEPPPARETSRVFWIGALIAVAVIVVIAGYYFKYGRVPPEGHFGQIEIATDTEAPVFGREPLVAGEPGGGETGTPAAVSDSVAAAASADGDSLAVTGPGTAGGTGSGQTVSEPDPGVGEAGDVTLQDQVSAEPQDTPKAEEVPAESPAEVPAEVPADKPAAFDMEPYRGPVGAKGWALHVYSFPDSAGAAVEVRELDRRGFTSEVRIFDLGEKGRWRRVYVGSFASRSEAREAMPALFKKLRVDWAKPEIFKTSAPE